MKFKSALIVLMASFLIGTAELSAQAVKDADGNVYATGTIGKQVWLLENLRTTKYNDGTEIKLVKDGKQWAALKSGAYCYFNNSEENLSEYGALYNWYTVNTGKLCPKGWHVPTDTEWSALMTFAGGRSAAGVKLKESGDEHWQASMLRATNDFDFSAIAGGLRHSSGTYPMSLNMYAAWWTSTSYNPSEAWSQGLSFSSDESQRGYFNKLNGFSVRCIKD